MIRKIPKFVLGSLLIQMGLFPAIGLAGGKIGSKIPQFSLKDPAGKTHSTDTIIKEGSVIVVTAPILSNQGAQEGWSDQLLKAKGSNKASLVFLEDMEPSNFKGKALKEMKKEYKPGQPPILLIDEKGDVREKMGVEKKKTVVLVYDSDGKLVHRVDAKPSANLAKQIWGKAKK